jgi:branched-chain amino acid transport system substrate-binding protein
VLYHAAYHREAALILRQAREAGMANLRLISNDDLNVRDFWSIAGAGAAGSLFTFEADPRRTPDGAEVARRFEAQGFDPTGYTLYSYAAVQIFAQAAEAAGGVQSGAAAARHARRRAGVPHRARPDALRRQGRPDQRRLPRL